MKIKENWLIIVMLLLILGVILYYERKPVTAEPPIDCMWVKMDPNSSRTYSAILLPALNRTYGEIGKLKAQNQWLRKSMNKCLEKLETERGFLPILPKYYQSQAQYEESEPLFVPYEEPNIPSLLEEPESNIKILACMMNIRSVSNRFFIDLSTRWIENFEERLKRLDPNQP